MSQHSNQHLHLAIACGGTGGHVFPGCAVAELLLENGHEVSLLVSPKEVDRQAASTFRGVEIVTLPAVCLSAKGGVAFMRGFIGAYRAAQRHFANIQPNAVLGMGGFTSVPPILAARAAGIPTFVHESNTIPGRANRWLSRVVNHAFVGFPSASPRLKCRRVTVTGTPVRRQFTRRDAASCRLGFGLAPERPALLVMGGSQGANGINELILQALPLFKQAAPECQWIHLAGPHDAAKIRAAYAQLGLSAVVYPFFEFMDLALSAASAAVTRAGASTLAEIAAMRLPALLIPYPHATDNHQFHNANAYAASGAGRLLQQQGATPESVSQTLLELVKCGPVRQQMQIALGKWHRPQAAQHIVRQILEYLDVAAAQARGKISIFQERFNPFSAATPGFYARLSPARGPSDAAFNESALPGPSSEPNDRSLRPITPSVQHQHFHEDHTQEQSGAI